MAAAAQQQPAAAAAGPPPVLDRNAFTQVVRVPALRVPKQQCQALMKKLRGHTFDVPKTRCVVHDGDRDDVRLVLLSQRLDPSAPLSPEVASLLEPHDSFEVVTHDVTLGYSHLTADAVLKRLLPPGVEVPSSFEAVGHIAHFNLRQEVLPYKSVIGQVILDKNPTIKTVINKVGTIESEYRVFEMEVIAGEAQLETDVWQHGVRFRLDYSKVYWNSRLEAEHQRLVATYFRPGDVIADVMAGIGPFAVPAGLAGCTVLANDLNPDSARYLALNIRLNKVGGQVTPFNMDGRGFIRLLAATPGGPADALAAEQPAQDGQEAQQQQPQQLQAQQPAAPAQQQDNDQQQQQHQDARVFGTRKRQAPKASKLVATLPPAIPPGFTLPPGGLLFDHAVMNLPASAVEFLDAFRGALDPGAWAGRPLPLVHVYTFQKGETQADVLARVEAALGGKLEEPPAIHVVRDVAPNKVMLCVTFRLPAAVAFHGRQHQQQQQSASPQGGGSSGEQQPGSPAAKKPKHET